MVRRLSWTVLIGIALVSATLLAIRGTQRANSDIVLYRIAEVATFATFAIPFFGYLALRRFYVSERLVEHGAGRKLLASGLIIWAGLFALMFLLSPDSRGKTELQFLWSVLSPFIFVLPLGAWVLNAQGQWNKAISRVALSACVMLGLAFAIARFAVAPSVLLDLGPWIAFAFAVLLLCVFMLNFGSVSYTAWVGGHAAALAIAVVYSHFIFFQGIFLGGGLALHLFFLILLVSGTAIVALRRFGNRT